MDEDKVRMEIEEDDMGNSFQKTYGWVVVVNKITDNDFTKHEYVYQRSIMEVLNQLSYLINYDEERERMMKKAQNS